MIALVITVYLSYALPSSLGKSLAMVLPAFEKANNVKVVIVPGTSSDILAKVQANKDNPQMHVMFLDDGIMYRAISMGLCDKLAPSAPLDQIPAKAKIKDEAVGSRPRPTTRKPATTSACSLPAPCSPSPLTPSRRCRPC